MARLIWLSSISAILAAQLAASPAASADSVHLTAQRFAQRLVQRMNTDSWVSDRNTRNMDPSFERLMRDNNRLAQGEDLLDADPICQCQDSGGRYQLLSVAPKGAMTDARIGLDDRSGYTLVLRRSDERWLIYDVINSDGSLRTQLTRHNACMRTNRSDAAVMRCFNTRWRFARPH